MKCILIKEVLSSIIDDVRARILQLIIDDHMKYIGDVIMTCLRIIPSEIAVLWCRYLDVSKTIYIGYKARGRSDQYWYGPVDKEWSTCLHITYECNSNHYWLIKP